MLNDYIGGGQVFLHKIRMFMQVLGRSVAVSVLVSSLVAGFSTWPKLASCDLPAAFSYQKAQLARDFDASINYFRSASLGKSKPHMTVIDANSRSGLHARAINPKMVISHPIFKQAYLEVSSLILRGLYLFLIGLLATFCFIFVAWWKFGKMLKNDRKVRGGKILDSSAVSSILRSLNLASNLHIGKMPLVKNSHTQHFLISGSTGCGKTNLLDTLLPQIEALGQPAIIVDQTGEMIAKYYNPERGDVIFNPLDARGRPWDFWADCFPENLQHDKANSELEKFAKILFSFNRKQSLSNSDPFWENSAEIVFTACANYLNQKGTKSIKTLQAMIQNWRLGTLAKALAGTPAARYLNEDNRITAGSILSVLATSTKPLAYLQEAAEGSSFSLKAHMEQVRQGSRGWLFLATSPSKRELTLPLTSCLLELAVSYLMNNIDHERGKNSGQNLWFILDEFAALGRLPALTTLMTEGRKYGACVVAAMQSLNQLYANYGQYAGQIIFGQFGTKFFFRNDEPQIAKMISDLAGSELISRQQKNTSFGANEFRDGVSYTEQEKSRSLIEYHDIASLGVGECYVLLPNPKVRLAKIEVPEAKVSAKHAGFMPCGVEEKRFEENGNSEIQDQIQDRTQDEPITAAGTANANSHQATFEKDQDAKELAAGVG